MTSSITIDGIAGTGDDVRDPSGRPLKLDDPATVTTIPELTMAHDVAAIHTRLREEWGDMAPVELEPGARAWLVMGYRTIVAMARGQLPLTTATGTWSGHERGVSSAESPLLRPLAPSDRQTVEHVDGKLHARLRTPLDEVLGVIDDAEIARTTRARCEELIDGFAGTGVADLVREYVTPMPHLTFGTFLGFDADAARRVFDVASLRADGRGGAADVHEVSFLLTGQTAARRPDGEPTPAGRLAQHPSYENTAEAALGLLSLTAIAARGLRSWLAQTLYLALTDTRFAGRLAGGQLGIDEALDEVLWAAAPVTALSPRIAAEDFLLGDKLVQAGDAILLAVGALGSDPSIRGEDSWDGSGSRAHLTFGVGAHACPAPHLARLIVRTAAETLLHRLAPELAARAEELRWAPDFRFRLLEQLPVVFRPEQQPEPESYVP
ncbi:cytochrome P450 [Myceligenerans pegani]|uniref:Cytochrome P450 n=1 Tax=Myceligenerans pegani TaxID=2776917 RepID=A0ABR9MTZ7_9MICO|nr:cytochrome P450 [Myceligenerans sp. TRM 65318]MBE1874541.1 cytochrome P450 [Myceligenerans sp. TRM 65318]MBE3016812.1 cytochrome P450 [Myceligenerans sp. TRM 65318]